MIDMYSVMKKQFAVSRFLFLIAVACIAISADKVRLSTDSLKLEFVPVAKAEKLSKKEKEAKLKYKDGIKTRRRGPG